jgi:hypothetical protein
MKLYHNYGLASFYKLCVIMCFIHLFLNTVILLEFPFFVFMNLAQYCDRIQSVFAFCSISAGTTDNRNSIFSYTEL